MAGNRIKRTTEITQATDILMRRFEIDADVAQALLTRLSTHYHSPASDVARRLISRSSAPAGERTRVSRSRGQAGAQVRCGSDDIDELSATLAHDVQAGRTEDRRRPRRPSSAYDDVADMFREMTALPEDSVQRKRAREEIIRRCMPLAEHIAHRFTGRGEASEDLMQVARLGLVNAINRFDVGTGTDFVAFAVPTIMGEVRRHFRDNSWAVKVPRRLKDLYVQLGPASAELSQRLGRAPTASELAEELDLDRQDVVETLIAGSGYSAMSMDRPGRMNDETPSLAETIGDFDANMDRIEDREALRPLLTALPEREQTLITLRFFESLTQTQIAERLGISQMHVSRLLARTLATLRDNLEAEPVCRTTTNS